MQLGRKKSADIPLPQGGAADYMLTVAGAGRWILETKPPNQKISIDDIDQTISYARHPEVSGHYAAVLNGQRFLLFFSTQTSNDKPILDLEVTTGETLAQRVMGLLSPLAIRRDCTPPVVDLRAPLAPGFRGDAKIVGGRNTHVGNEIETDFPLPAPVLQNLKSQTAKIVGMSSTARGGRIWRDEASRIRVQISWYPPHDDMKPMLQAAHLDEFEYVCLGESISTDSAMPSVFDILASYELRRGQPTYDLLQWKASDLGFDMDVILQGQATGYLASTEFSGTANFQSIARIGSMPFQIVTHFTTKFAFQIDPR
ncbi:MAG: hypothetical protein GC166_11320 [Alphaproteobacteria bacterium]|nr:hypothetical protein [Alphaproteobacteria bacterium]